MKRTVFILVAIAAALVSCDKIESDKPLEESAVRSDSLFYSGTLLANASSGDCTTPDMNVSINLTFKSDSVSISLFKAKLAQRMPAMDIVIPNITMKKEADVTLLTSVRAVPLAMGNEFPAYTVTGFNGRINGDSLNFSLSFGSTPTSFNGKIIK